MRRSIALRFVRKLLGILGIAGAVGMGGCYMGTARDFSPAALRDDPGWIAVEGLVPMKQTNKYDCGPVALTMLLRYWGVETNPVAIRGEERRGEMSGGHLRKAARDAGLEAFLISGEIADLEKELAKKRPVLVGMVKQYLPKGLAHFEVVVAIHPKRQIVVTLDPAKGGWRQNHYKGFMTEWGSAKKLSLIVFRAKNGQPQPPPPPVPGTKRVSVPPSPLEPPRPGALPSPVGMLLPAR